MFRILRAENRIRWLVEVGDSAAFAHKFRVVADCKVFACAESAGVLERWDDQRFRGSRQNCAAQDDDVVRFFLLQGGADFTDYALDVSEVEFSAALAGCAYTDEGNVGLADCNRGFGSGPNPAGLVAVFEQFAHASFDNGAAA